MGPFFVVIGISVRSVRRLGAVPSSIASARRSTRTCIFIAWCSTGCLRPPGGVVFHRATGIETEVIAAVPATVRRRLLSSFVRRSWLDSDAAHVRFLGFL